VSGGHFNPVVSFVDAAFGGLTWRTAAAYLPAQVAGCVIGAVVANLMFSLAAVSISTHHRASPAHFLSEIIATAGLILVIFSLARSRRATITPAAVGAYIGAAYFFTSSTSFANPAITIGRMFSNTFAGITPASVPEFVVAQLVGGAVATGRGRRRQLGRRGPAFVSEQVRDRNARLPRWWRGSAPRSTVASDLLRRIRGTSATRRRSSPGTQRFWASWVCGGSGSARVPARAGEACAARCGGPR